MIDSEHHAAVRRSDWGRDDWAIVVGIDRYPGLADLTGAENDATAFCHWLRDVGQVPDAHIVRLVSSDFAMILDAIERNHRPSVRGAMPSEESIRTALDELFDRTHEHIDARQGPRIGRRLYLFFAGHGLEPRDSQEPVFLAANAHREHIRHVPPRRAARWFSRASAFDEVVLLMDCCREQVPRLELVSALSWIEMEDVKRKDKPFLHGFAAQPCQAARELDHQGTARGLFTRAVLEGLGGAATDEQGAVTARALKDHLVNFPVQVLLPESARSTAPEWRPAIDIDDYAAFELVPADLVPSIVYRLKVRLSPVFRGHKLEILRGDQKIELPQIDELEWAGPMAKGVYRALVFPPSDSADPVMDRVFTIQALREMTLQI